MKKSCTICGCSYGEIYAFKGGNVCEDCIQFLKADIPAKDLVRACDHTG